MQDSSAFQFLAIDTIHESTTNPRRTFDEAKLYELADSIKPVPTSSSAVTLHFPRESQEWLR